MIEPLIAKLLAQGQIGDDTIDVVIAMAASGDVHALELVEEAIESEGRKKLDYFRPGLRVSSGEDIYNPENYQTLLAILKTKAHTGKMLENAADTQDEITRLLNNISADRGVVMTEIREAGGWHALKIFQLLYTHLQVQAHLINAGQV